MKRFYLILILSVGFLLFSDNKVSIITKSDRVLATIQINENENITLNDELLFLYVESKEYNFTFSGYPDGFVNDSGDIYYTKELTLEGLLTLKEGIEPKDYNINVILGFQTSDMEGLNNIPVEISEEILVKKKNITSNIPIILGLVAIIIFVILLIIRRKQT